MLLDSDDDSDDESDNVEDTKNVTKNIRAYSLFQTLAYTLSNGRVKTPLHVMAGGASCLLSLS